MKITNKQKMQINRSVSVLCSCMMLLLTGCGQSRYDMAYTVNSDVSSLRLVNIEEKNLNAEPFASDLCVASSDISIPGIDTSKADGAGLFDVNGRNTLYAKNVYEKLYPASLTKIMMTLDQALHVLLINSANDAAIMIAEGIAGSVEAFADMMNQEALEVGATNSHFVNPHGLSDNDHYTTVYDMYLITNAAIQYDRFNEIIHMKEYQTVYYDKSGNAKDLSVNSTNYYLQGNADAPSGITVLGGKTGTTNAAGHCLVLVSRDTSGNPYISVIMRAESREDLYDEMSSLLSGINK